MPRRSGLDGEGRRSRHRRTAGGGESQLRLHAIASELHTCDGDFFQEGVLASEHLVPFGLRVDERLDGEVGQVAHLADALGETAGDVPDDDDVDVAHLVKIFLPARERAEQEHAPDRIAPLQLGDELPEPRTILVEAVKIDSDAVMHVCESSGWYRAPGVFVPGVASGYRDARYWSSRSFAAA